jgi:hypothetical protein
VGRQSAEFEAARTAGKVALHGHRARTRSAARPAQRARSRAARAAAPTTRQTSATMSVQ